MVCRLAAVAELERRSAAMDPMRGRAQGGDSESAWLIDEWRAGRVLPARVQVSAIAEIARDEEIVAERVIEGVWLELADPPLVEAQVVEAAASELPALLGELRERGVDVAGEDLESAFVHVELARGLRHAMWARPASA